MNAAASPPRIALLVPCHNAAAFLPRLWESVRAQTTPFAELLVYDDASSDDTASVAEALGARVLRGAENQGPGAARNHLLAATACEWIHFHDADDRLHPDFVTRMGARAALDDRDVLLCQVDWLDEHTRTVVLRWRYDESVYQTPDAPADMLVNIIGGIGGLYRTHVLRAVSGFRTQLRYWEDMDLHLRLWHAGARFGVVDEVLSWAHRHESSTSNRNLSAVWRAKTALLADLVAAPSASARFIAAAGAEAEMILNRQLESGDLDGARVSLALALRCGIDVPTSGSRLLRLTRLLCGRWPAARLQHTIRRLASNHSEKNSRHR